MTTDLAQKEPPKYNCECCYFTSSNKYDFNRHLSTQKHKQRLLLGPNNVKIVKYTCDNCSKTFNDRAGLWRHKHKCIDFVEPIPDFNLTNEEKHHQLVELLLKENSDFKQFIIDQNKHMMELLKQSGNNSHNTTNTQNVNSHNKTFNLQFFLNETCKDAMNIMDFVSQLQVNVKDVEETGRLGFTEGISNIFINGLKQMNVSDRPIHCSDSKRETLYIKNNNEWNKEGDDKSILTNAIKHVAHKNMKQISIWAKEHPNYNNPSSKENDKYLQIVSESMPGLTNEETNKKYNKIIKNIVKETVIDK
jgi:hypothetical protein